MSFYKSGEVSGVVVPVKSGQVFRFAQTATEGRIFIPPRVVSGFADDLVEGARVKLVYKTEEKGLAATAILSIDPPTGPVFYRGVIKFFNSTSGYGFISECSAFPEIDIFLHASVCEGIVPLRGQELEFTAEEEGFGKMRVTAIRMSSLHSRESKMSAAMPAAEGLNNNTLH